MAKPTMRELQKLATRLGFRGLKSYRELYTGGAINTFGHPQNSIWTLTILLNPEGLCRGIEVHSTYFKSTEQIQRLNRVLSFKNPQSIDWCINFLKQ